MNSQLKLWTPILTALVLLTACSNPAVRRHKMVAQHPGWDATSVQMIQEGKLFKGMNKAQVRAAWGAPCQTCEGTTQGDWGSAWEYQTQVVFFSPDGHVTRWTTK